jgi:hypothetical protein
MDKKLIVGPKGFGGTGTKLVVTAKGFFEPSGSNLLDNIFKGSSNLTNIYIGSNQISAVYVGSTKVWG